MAKARYQEIGTPSTDSSSLTAGLPKRAIKLRVGYHGHHDAAEEQGLLVEGLRQLWRAGELCDVTLACRESTFRVHRLVLASQSSELREFLADRSEVQMPDVSYPESLQLCIEFLYEAEGEKGYAPSCAEINMEVLELAHKFQLPGLKRRAASFMAQALTTLNILRSLSACETFALHDLKEKIISHIAANKKVLAEIIDGPHIAKHPELLRQILLRVASAKDPNAPSKRARLSQ